ncbi:tripartite tricarboxylate transporter TctB family protein [Pseudooceanicola sediminis]|uniref:Tripartite tricarboxylate transporter TctB family protein n=1 Tax=Pseudooceanicola sediminis TaxID=2211117 RepID=A0A399IW60_9RHOB|nr:tripartite tricarboxylate transporter TctB family protein [Pseudooceanicola sediminis]KAA2315004.1 tripartite tricarboxylate transporter TctB family protein [Puniceibacterium sp. HSS470]RII37375.1 tripartite tricarboxylate transporter TctB family protein [Pseudooceanicola sediminis]|tara:strand:- start:62342 stop:62824 length:483 start_codon:yes stop_codon:yes gene_type:complete
MSGNAGFLRLGVVFPLVLMVLTTIYFAAAFDIHAQFTPEGEMGPQHIPMLVSGLMYVALLVVLVQELRAPAAVAETEEGASLLRPVLVVAATAAYIWLFRPLGYALSTALFVAALFVVFKFETRRPLVFALYVVGVVAVFYGLFAGIFGVRLPTLIGDLI